MKRMPRESVKVSLASNSYFAQNIRSQSLGATSDLMTNPGVSKTHGEDQKPPMKKRKITKSRD